jgi:hypothetical protein
MNPLLEKMLLVERELTTRFGSFTLFALIQRAEGLGLWDVVAVADWFGTDKKAALDKFLAVLKQRLSEEEMLTLSRIPVCHNRVRQIPVREIM